jgi:hypothetical protein
LLLATFIKGCTEWQVTVLHIELDVMRKLRELSKANLTTEEIKSNLLLATDSNGQAAWNVAVLNDRLDVMNKLWELAK